MLSNVLVEKNDKGMTKIEKYNKYIMTCIIHMTEAKPFEKWNPGNTKMW